MFKEIRQDLAPKRSLIIHEETCKYAYHKLRPNVLCTKQGGKRILLGQREIHALLHWENLRWTSWKKWHLGWF